MQLSREQAEIIEALRLESEPLARINLQIIGLGGQPITPRPQYLAQLREQKSRRNKSGNAFDADAPRAAGARTTSGSYSVQ